MATIYESIEEALQHKDQACHLDLYGDELFLPDLELSQDILELSNLKSLSISGYNQVSFPEGMASLQNLEKLELSYSLSEIPFWVVELQHLKTLIIESSQLRWFPDIQKLKKLEHLSFSGIQNIGKEIGMLPALKSLTLAAENIQSLPEECEKLSSLQVLDISYTGMHILPKGVCRLQNLRVLNISSTFIEELPLEIQYLQHLEELQFCKPFEHHNKEKYKTRVKQIRQVWGSLKNLKKLNLSHQHIMDVSSHVQHLDQLEELDLSYNEMPSIPEELLMLKHLKKLSLDFNQLTKLPDEIQQWSQLEKLSLIGNPLEDIEPLANIQTLKKIDLRGVKVSEKEIEQLKQALPGCELTVKNPEH